MNCIASPAVFAPLQTRVRAPRAAARATPVTCSARKAPVARAARTTKPAVSEEVSVRESREGGCYNHCDLDGSGASPIATAYPHTTARR
jgi:hypothetical protein